MLVNPPFDPGGVCASFLPNTSTPDLSGSSTRRLGWRAVEARAGRYPESVYVLPLRYSFLRLNHLFIIFISESGRRLFGACSLFWVILN